MPADVFGVFETLTKKLQLELIETPGFHSAFARPIFSITEDLIGKLDPRIEVSRPSVHDYEEIRRRLSSDPNFQTLRKILPNKALELQEDSRAFALPCTGEFEDMRLIIGMPFLNLAWKDSHRGLLAVYVAAADIGTQAISLGPINFMLRGVNSSATYVENGVISWYSFYKSGETFVHAFQYFLPPNMVISDSDTPIHPPYSRIGGDLAHPDQLKDVEPVIEYALEQAHKEGVDYTLQQQIRKDLTRNAKLVMLLADAHRQLYSI